MNFFRPISLILLFFTADRVMGVPPELCSQCNLRLEVVSNGNGYECLLCQLTMAMTSLTERVNQIASDVSGLSAEVEHLRFEQECLDEIVSPFSHLTHEPMVGIIRSSLHTAEATFIETTENHTQIQRELEDLMLNIGDHSLRHRQGLYSRQLSLRAMEAVNQSNPLTAERVEAMFNHVRLGNQVSMIIFDRGQLPLMSARLLPGLIAAHSGEASAAEPAVLFILQGQQAVTLTPQSLEVFINHFLKSLEDYPDAIERYEQRMSTLFGNQAHSSNGSSAEVAPDAPSRIFPCEMLFKHCGDGEDTSCGSEEPEESEELKRLEESEDEDLGAYSVNY